MSLRTEPQPSSFFSMMPKDVNPSDTSLGQAASAALDRSPNCPPEATLVELVTGGLDEQTALSVRAHAQECGSCAAEIGVALELITSEANTPSERVAGLVSLLAAAPRWTEAATQTAIPAEKSAGERRKPTEAPDASAVGRSESLARLERFALPLALAAGLILAIGLSLRPTSLPDLPAPLEGVVRGTTLRLSFPIGELDHPPTELRWEAIAEAVAYRAEIRNVAGTIIDRCVVASAPNHEPPVCPITPSAGLRPGARYSWRVQAFAIRPQTLATDASATPIASTGWTGFRLLSAQVSDSSEDP